METLSALNVIGAQPYELVREDCHALKGARSPFDPVVVRCACRLAEAMPDGIYFLVPLPSHHGQAVDSFHLAWAVAAEINRRSRQRDLHGCVATVCDILECDPHVSLCEAKHAGEDPDGIDVRVRLRDVPIAQLISRRPEMPVFLVDNVVDTGHTARACMQVLPSAKGILAVGDTGRHRGTV